MRPLLDSIKKLSIALAIIAMTGYLSNLLIDNPYVHGVLRREINRNLEQYTFLNIKFEAISAKFLPLGFDIYGIEVKQRNAPEAAPLFQAMHVQMRVSLWALLMSKRELLELEINGPKIAWPLPPLEQLLRMEKFPDLKGSEGLPEWPPKFAMPFHKLVFTNASVQVALPSSDPKTPDALRLRVEGFDLDLTYFTPERFDVKAEIHRLNLNLEGKDILLDASLKALLLQRGDTLTSGELTLNSTELKLESELRLNYEIVAQQARNLLVKHPPRHLTGLSVTLNNQVETADMAILGRYLQAADSQGPVSGHANLILHLPFDSRPISWHIMGHAASHGTVLEGFKLLDSQTDFRIDDKGMSFDSVRVMKGQELLAHGKGFLGFSGSVPFAYDIQPDKLSLPGLLDVLKVPGFTAVDAGLESDLIQLKGQALPFEIKVGGKIKFKDLTLPPVLKNSPARFTEAPSCNLQTELRIDASAVRIESASGLCQGVANNPASALTLKGRFAYTTAEGLDFQLNFPEAQASLLNHFTKIPATGLLKAQVLLKGPYDKIVIGGDVHAQNLDFGGFQGQRVSASFRFPIAEDRVYLRDLIVEESGRGSLEIEDAAFGLKAPYAFEASIAAQDLSKDFLQRGMEQTFGVKDLSFGIKALQGNLTGNLMEPLAYKGKIHFVAQDFKYDRQTFFHEASGTLFGDARTWQLQGVYARLDQLEAKLDVDVSRREERSQGKGNTIFHRLGIAPRDKVRVRLKTINQNLTQYRSNDAASGVNHLASLPYVGPYFKSHSFGGLIQLDADLEGTIGSLQGKIEGALEQPFVWGIPISSFYLSGFLDGLALHIPEFRHSGNALVGRINIDFSKPSLPYDWYFYLNQMDIRAFLTRAFADDPRNFAYLSAEWTMKGSLADFWSSNGELVLSRVRSKFFKNLGSRTSSIELNSDQAVKVQITPDHWRLSDKRPLKLQGEFFDLELSAGDNRLPDKLDLSLQGSIKLDILKNFTHLAETARGEIMVEGYLLGSIEKPDLSIRFRERKLDPFNMKEWSPVSLGVVDYGPPLTALSLDVEVKSDRLIVHSLHANKGREGTIDATGVLGFSDSSKDMTRLQVKLDRIEMNRLRVPVLKSADLVLSGDLALSGSALPLSLTGNLRIDRFYSLGNFDLRREIVASLYETRLNASVRNAQEAASGPYFKLDVGIVADKSIVLKNKSIEAVLSTNLRVRGSEAQPLLLGQIIADRGSFSYRRLFKINQAVISFDEPVSPPNPRLDIIGETTVNPYQVQVLVGGELANPKVTLTCDPPNRDDGSPISNLDIVLLISTGKIPEQANKTAEKASVNEIFSSFLVFAEEPIEKLFDLSGQTVIREVYVDSYLSEAEQRPITRLNVPFNLWGTANAVVQVDDESNTKLSFEYPIHEGISFTGSLDSKKNTKDSQENNIPKDTGFDLKFRFGFD